MNSEIQKYFEKQKSLQKEILIKLRKIIFKTYPKIKEEMKWGVPSFDEGKYYLVALKDSVNIGFSVKGLNKKEMDLFEGTGKTMRNLKISSVKEIDEKRITNLLKLVEKNSK
ncbi:MAG: DUF1801 domain-containing protein [Candidatus Diapherotrites archaeon]|nr:DUF1801 domain-containing protein [Candidatus Diapherotrites archaeon]